LDVIYIQAKRWEGTVGRPEIHKFVGALQGQRATKGIFITTSTFSEEAREYASSTTTRDDELERLLKEVEQYLAPGEP
jgi:restriction system protein